MTSTEYQTLAGEHREEPPRTKGSRFIATARPIADEDEAARFVERIRREFHDARHTCWAYRLGPDGERWRYHDDGEPAGSAGRPILQQIEGRGLTQTVVAVTRYFGGVKLGVGGLVRAYGAAAGQVLALAPARTVVLTRDVVVHHPYECASAVQALLATWGLKPTAADYSDAVRLELQVPQARLTTFLEELRDRTAGRARVEA